MNLEAIATDMLKCAIGWDPAAKVIGNVSAADVARVAAHVIGTCPKCGATAWVNIDCDLCNVCHGLLHEGERRPNTAKEGT
jgi:hypothetical protein